jgi:hypothetical protein
MSLLKRIVPVLGCLLLLSTYLYADVTPPSVASPQVPPFRTELKKELSSLNVSIVTSTDDLANTLNRMIPQQLYKGSTTTRGLTADILRNGPISASAADNYIYLSVPIAVTFKTGFFQTPAITTKLKFKLNASVTPDWKVNAEVYYLGLSDLLAEEVRIGPLSVKPRSMVEGVTQPVQRIVTDLITRKLNEKFPLKEQVAKVWNASQKPILLDKNYSAWLRMMPQEVLLDPLYARNNQVKLNVGIKSFADLVIGPEPPARPTVQLPNLKLTNGMDKTFRIALHTDLFYKDIVAVATPLLLNKELGSDDKSVILKEFDLYGSGDHLKIKVAMTGTLEGTFFLTCRPVFNLQTNQFSVEEVEFDMENTSFLLRAANWFLHGTIRGIIQEKLNVDLTQRLEQARSMADKAMSRVTLAENIFLSGSIKTMKFNDIMVQQDKISIQVYAEGETAIGFR